MEPIAAVVAAAAPEMAPKNILAIIATRARPPENLPTMEFAKSTSLFEIPPNSINEPAKIKNGTAINGKESVAVNIFWTITSKGIFPFITIATIEDSAMAIAIGTFIIKKNIRLIINA